MKRVTSIWLKLALVICFVFSLMLFPACKAKKAEGPIKIGVILSLTGPGAFIGLPQKEVFDTVIEGVNKDGGLLGQPVEVYYEDDKSNPTNAVVAVTKLIKDQNVCLITGPSIVDSGLAMIPIAEQEGVPFIVTGPLVAPFKKHVFLLGPGDERGAVHILNFVVNKMGGMKIAILRDTTQYGSEASKYYNMHIKDYAGASIVIEEKCEWSDTSMIPQLTKIKAANPDVMIIHTIAPVCGVIAKNYKQLGMKTPVFGCHGMPAPEFLALGGKVAEENKWIMTASKMLIAEKLPAGDKFRKNIYDPFKKLLQAKYGPEKTMNVFYPVTFDGLMVGIEAIKKAGSTDRAAIRDAIEDVKYDGFVGLFDVTATDHQGSPKDTMPEMMVMNGEFVPYTK